MDRSFSGTRVFDVTPVAKPRMSQRDQWNERPVVNKYFAFRDQIPYLSRLKCIQSIPVAIGSIIFNIPMPGSWSKNKRVEMNGRPHQQTPDLDNYLKGFLDAVCSEDRHIHCIGKLRKVWAEAGNIEITLPKTCDEVSAYKCDMKITSDITSD